MKLFLKSLKLDKDFLKVMSYDIFYYAVFVGLIAVYISVVLPKLAFYHKAVTFVQSLQLQTTTPLEELLQQADELRQQLMLFLGLTFTVVLVLICNYSFFKGFIWSKLLGKPFTVKTFFHYLSANALFLLCAAVILYLTNAFVPESMTTQLVLVYLLFAIYFVNLYHPMLFLEKGVTFEKLKKHPHLFITFLVVIITPIATAVVIFGKTVWYGIVYVYRLILPFVAMFVLFMILNAGLWLLKYILPYYLFLVLYLLALVIYFSWCKVYVKNVLVA